MNIYPGRTAWNGRKRQGTVSVIFWAFLFGVMFGYILNMWHQIAQKQHRVTHEDVIEFNDFYRNTTTYYNGGQSK